MADWDADAITKAYERSVKPVGAQSMCWHGCYAKNCPLCGPAKVADVSEAEKDRRLKAFMPLLHQMVNDSHTPGYAPDEVLVERIERILEIVEHPRRRVSVDDIGKAAKHGE